MEEPQKKTLLTTSTGAESTSSQEVAYSDLPIERLVDLAMHGFGEAVEELTKRLGGVNPFEDGK
jgi:hypothetical protein